MKSHRAKMNHFCLPNWQRTIFPPLDSLPTTLLCDATQIASRVRQKEPVSPGEKHHSGIFGIIFPHFSQLTHSGQTKGAIRSHIFHPRSLHPRAGVGANFPHLNAHLPESSETHITNLPPLHTAFSAFKKH